MINACRTARNCGGNRSGVHVSPASTERNSKAFGVPAIRVLPELGSLCTNAAGPPYGPSAFHSAPAAAGSSSARIGVSRHGLRRIAMPLRPERRDVVEHADRQSRVRLAADDHFEFRADTPIVAE